MDKIALDKDLIKDAMQSLAYFAFIGAIFRFGGPEVKSDINKLIPFTLIFLTLLFFIYIFTIIHVIRPGVQIYYPEFGLKGIDSHYRPLNRLHPANVVFVSILAMYIYIGWFIVSIGLMAGLSG